MPDWRNIWQTIVKQNWAAFASFLAVLLVTIIIFLLVKKLLLSGLKKGGNEQEEARDSKLFLQSVISNATALAVAIIAGYLGMMLASRLLGVNADFILSPMTVWLLGSGLRLFLILVGAWLALRFVNLLVVNLDKFFPRLQKDLGAEEQRRLQTLENIFSNVLKLLIILIAMIMALREIGFDVTALVTAAGVGGLAISLGAQDLIKDYLSGFFILLEDQVRVGDVIEVNKLSGLVEQLTLRTITLRSLDGTIHIIPNRQVTTVSNMTKSYSRYVIDVEVAYKESVDQVMQVLKEIGRELANDPEFAEKIEAPFEVLGVDKFGSSGVAIKTMITTKPLEQWAVGRELRRRIKNRFDELGIEIPFPHVSLYWGEASSPIQVDLGGELPRKQPNSQEESIE